MKNLKHFSKINILTNGSSFQQATSHLLVNTTKLYVSYIKQDCFTHPLWVYGHKNLVQNTTNKLSILPFYSKFFKF